MGLTLDGLSVSSAVLPIPSRMKSATPLESVRKKTSSSSQLPLLGVRTLLKLGSSLKNLVSSSVTERLYWPAKRNFALDTDDTLL